MSSCGHYHNNPKSCVKNTHKESIKFSPADTLILIRTSIVKIGYEAYVPGLIFQFYQQKRPPVMIGYFLPGVRYRSPFSGNTLETLTYSYQAVYPGHLVLDGNLKQLLGFSFCKDENGIHSITVIDRDDRPRRIASCLQNKTDNRTDLILDNVTEVIVTLDVSSLQIYYLLVEAEIRNSIAKLSTWKSGALLRARNMIESLPGDSHLTVCI